jgi:arabinogalactan endo-1,4-beta-galactosidase
MGNLGSGNNISKASDPVAPNPRISAISQWRRLIVVLIGCCFIHASQAQQPAEPIDPSPINGETYSFLNQLSAMQMDLNSNSAVAGDVILQNPASFTSLSQRWALTKVPSGNWKISNLLNGLCLDSTTASGSVTTVQNPCGINIASQEWTFTYTSNGYNTVINVSSGYALDIAGSSASAGAHLDQSHPSNTPTQGQQWLFRPVFYRGNDNALQGKEEAERVAGSVPWWQDAGQPQDLLQIMKNHGFNVVRIRPTSISPYQTYTLGSSIAMPSTCTGNACYAETDAADLDLAKRAKQLGMSVELSLFFDGGSSTASPSAWAGFSVAQTKTAIYNYTKAQIEAYRAAGAMPDMVSIGNEVDTGFLGSLGGSPSGSASSTSFLNFSAYETAGMQAVTDAAADPSLGVAIPPPVRCIHITPAWDLTSFFSEANADSIPYDAICQSYYPIYHGPLTATQAAASNPNNKPVEQTALTNAANSIGKPIFLIEIGEHYENGFDANDPWYAATRAGQRQFVLDVESVLKGLPNNLAMGIDYWDSAGTNIPNTSGFTAGDGKVDGTYIWNGLTLFDNADTSGSASINSPVYNAVLPAMSAVGGKLDPSLSYKFVNANDGRILETAAALTTSGASLDTGLDSGITSQHQEWQITSNNDGYFQIANLNPATPANVLDTNGLTTSGSLVVQIEAASNTPSQEWDVVTAGNGYFTIVNKASGLVLGTAPGSSGGAVDVIQQQTPASTNADWITPASRNQMWQILPVHIVAASTPAALAFDPATITSINSGGNPGTVNVDVENTASTLIGSPSKPVALTITGPGSFSQTVNAVSTNGVASFNLSNVVLTSAGTYSLAATSSGLTSASTSFIVTTPTPTTATMTVLTAPTISVFGTSLTLTATVTGTVRTPQPGGSVTFKDGTVMLGNGTLNSSGMAMYATGSLAVGLHSLTASYAGDTYNASSVSNPVSVTVTAVQTTTALTSSAGSVPVGTSLTFSAIVTGTHTPGPTGSVMFKDGMATLGSGILNSSGIATYATSSLAIGLHSIAASYAGDTDNAFSMSNVVPVTVTATPDFAISLLPTSATVTNGSSTMSTITITPINAFNGPTSLSCSGLPSFTSCSFSPASVTPIGSAATLVLTIATNMPTASTDRHTPFHNGLPTWLEPVDSGALFVLVFWPFVRNRKGLNFRMFGVGFLVAIATLSTLGCGGSGSGGSSGPKTPRGQFAVIIAATSGTLSHSSTFQLTVQ